MQDMICMGHGPVRMVCSAAHACPTYLYTCLGMRSPKCCLQVLLVVLVKEVSAYRYAGAIVEVGCQGAEGPKRQAPLHLEQVVPAPHMEAERKVTST